MLDRQIATKGPLVLIRGAGEQATGVGWVLTKAGFRVVMTEVEQPLMVRWPVSFGTAIPEGRWQVEGIWAQRISSADESLELWAKGEVPVIVDPELTQVQEFKPAVLIDAILAKHNTGTRRNLAGFVVGVGPGFTAGVDADVVVETKRGHDLGRLIYSGSAEANTGIPGNIAGYTAERVLYSQADGEFTARANIGERVQAGEKLGSICTPEGELEVVASIDGILRGLIRTGTPVKAKIKIGDIDPRDCPDYCWTISDKARTLGTSVLLSIIENKLALN